MGQQLPKKESNAVLWWVCGGFISLLVLAMAVRAGIDHLTTPDRLIDPCTKRSISSASANGDWFDRLAWKRSKEAYRGSPTAGADCTVAPANPKDRAALVAMVEAREQESAASSDGSYYEAARAQGYSDEEAKQIAPNARRICEAGGGQNC